ncbi:Uu.00g131580.m01.CDS01 [Anthostomella pinea]|uniref:Uu.00g131580.m01.CDS01 n=1 Tax=Anthostomella pinea TaxID=933095 RepID=A0AAI8VIW1_9PEZI|nr:Uu.00g131580.m01.CDS01 [Anthostomella pinea]
MSEPLTKVDSAVEGLPESPVKEKAGHRRASSHVAGVASVKDMWETKTPLAVAKETQQTGWKINTSATSVEDRDILDKPLVTPLVRAIELHFKHGVVVTARNRTGVTIKDALTAIHRQYKKRTDDELGEPYLKGFEWVPDHEEYAETPEKQKEKQDDWQQLYIHLSSTPGVSNSGGKKKKKEKNAE